MDQEELQYKIRSVLHRTGMSNTALSELIGVTNSAVGHWLAGRYMPNKTNQERINTFYGMARAGTLTRENQAINVPVDYKLFQQVKKEAKKQGLSPNEFVSEVLVDKLSEIVIEDAPVVEEAKRPKRSFLDFFRKKGVE